MKPIIFTGESVRAILEGRKVQTRRVIKPQPPAETGPWPDEKSCLEWSNILENTQYYVNCGWCPYGKRGEQLWCKETWTTHENDKGADCLLYKADVPDPELYGPWKSPLFMPRRYSRITLEIESIKVERLQAMGFYDWIKDFHPTWQEREAARASFTGAQFQVEHSKKHWDEINAKRGYPWNSNPWVWVLGFRVAKA